MRREAVCVPDHIARGRRARDEKVLRYICADGDGGEKRRARGDEQLPREYGPPDFEDLHTLDPRAMTLRDLPRAAKR